MPKVIGVITARMGSTRLPGKVLKKLGSKSILAHHVERMNHVRGLDGVFIATSTDPENQAIIQAAGELGCGWFAGSEQDVVGRHVELCRREQADAVLRITCDCPIFNIVAASEYVRIFKQEYHDYIYVCNMTMIQGTLAELISCQALVETHKHYRGAVVNQYIRKNMGLFKTLGLEIEADLCRPEYRLTIDEAIDIEMIHRIYEALYADAQPLDLHKVYTWLDDNPQVAAMNMQVGIKGCEQLNANLVDRMLYSVVPSGTSYVILDEQKRQVQPRDFMAKLMELFPQLRQTAKEHP